MNSHKSTHGPARHARLGTLTVWVPLAAAFLSAVPAMPAMAKPAPKVEICHIPPGNPANAHTIKVSGNAIKAHLKHGDYIGPCEPLCEETCDDGNACTTDECDAGECVHSAVDCNDGNQCTADSCNPETGGCESLALAGEPCTDQDGSACTLDSGVCSATGDCELTAIPDCCESDAECADADLCTFEACANNACVPDGAVDCTPADACEQSGCDPATGACVDLPVICDPPGPCEAGGSCIPVGGCTYSPIPGCCLSDEACDDGDNCTSDVCFNNACVHDTCHDPLDPCLQYDGCDEQCSPIATGPTDCGDGINCTDDDCDPEQGGCLNPPTDCTDDDPCTEGEYCDEDLGCQSSPVTCPTPEDPCFVAPVCDTDAGGCGAPVAKCDAEAGEICNELTGECELDCGERLVCTFTEANSSLTNYYVPTPFAPGSEVFGIGGAVNIDCEPLEGECACRAAFDDKIGPIVVPNLGVACLVPAPADACEVGAISCEAGNGQNVELVQHHTIGTCTDNPGCKADCETFCSDQGFERVPNSPACEGFCRQSGVAMCLPDNWAGSPDNDFIACAPDDICDESVNVLGVPYGHDEFCGCQCMKVVDNPPTPAGEAILSIGYSIEVFFDDTRWGDDGEQCTADDGEPDGTLAPTCAPFTTSTAEVLLLNAGYYSPATSTIPIDETIDPPAATGAPLTCSGRLPATASGARLQGVVSFKDTPRYDYASVFTLNCE